MLIMPLSKIGGASSSAVITCAPRKSQITQEQRWRYFMIVCRPTVLRTELNASGLIGIATAIAQYKLKGERTRRRPKLRRNFNSLAEKTSVPRYLGCYDKPG